MTGRTSPMPGHILPGTPGEHLRCVPCGITAAHPGAKSCDHSYCPLLLRGKYLGPGHDVDRSGLARVEPTQAELEARGFG